MITPEELKDLVLYKKEVLLPTTEKKKFGSAVMMLTPNYESTKNMMNLPYITDKFKSYESYYTERNVMRYINTEGKLEADYNDDEYLHEVSEEELFSDNIVQESSILLEGSINITKDIVEKMFADIKHGVKWCCMDDGAFYSFYPNLTILGDNTFSCGCFREETSDSVKAKVLDFVRRSKSATLIDEDENNYRSYSASYRLEEIGGNTHIVGTFDDVTSLVPKPKKPITYISESTSYIEEKALSSKERKELALSDYGLPDKCKYPMTDAAHVQSAIRFFNYVSEDDEQELAQNIIKKAKKFNVPIRCGKKNRLSKYITEDTAYNGFLSEDMYGVINGTIKQHIAQMQNPGQYDYVKSTQYPFTKRKKKVLQEVDKECKKCTKCGSKNIGVFFFGEPVYKCKDCDKYLGVVPFRANKKKAVNEAFKLPGYLYHGSIDYYDELRPTGVDFGNAFQKPGWSLYCWTKYDYGVGWSIFQCIKRIGRLTELEVEEYGCIDSHIPMIPQSTYDTLKENMNNIDRDIRKFYVYTIKPESDFELGLGHSSNTPNCVTIRKDHIEPTRVDEFILDMDMIDKYCKVVEDGHKMSSKEQGLNARLLSFLMTNDYMFNFKERRKINKDIEAGLITPGCDLVAYMKDVGIDLYKPTIKDRLFTETEEEDEPSTPINRVALACQDLIDLFDKKLDIKYDAVSIYPEEQGIVFAKAYDGESATAIKNYLNMNLQSMNPEYTVDFINATGDDIHQLGDYYIYVTYDGYKGVSGIITNNMQNNIF